MRASKILPFAILGVSALVVVLLYFARRTPEDRVQQSAAPLVRVAIAEPTPYRYSVTAHGSVSPRTESDLIPQVSGEVLWVSPALASGGFFGRGDVLARIDAADYRVEVSSTQASVARAKSEFDRAEKERSRQRRLAKSSVASESRIDDAENAFRIAQASLVEAQSRLERATRDLARTELSAPYRGRVRSEQVDVGQFVTRGTPIARLYAVDYAEIRLPVPDRELAYLDVPMIPRPRSAGEESGARLDSVVTLTAEFAGRMHEWKGTLVRTEGELDPRSRMVNLVARVSDPYGLSEGVPEDGQDDFSGRARAAAASPEVADDLGEYGQARLGRDRSTPLSVGLFVEALIEGHAIDRAFVLPRDALREGNQVYLVDAEDRIQFRDVEVLRTERENVILGAGLSKGDRVCTSPLQAAINGMRVRVVVPSGDATDDSVAEGLVRRDAPPNETIQ